MTAPARESECTIYDIIVECSLGLPLLWQLLSLTFEPSDDFGGDEVVVESFAGRPTQSRSKHTPAA